MLSLNGSVRAFMYIVGFVSVGYNFRGSYKGNSVRNNKNSDTKPYSSAYFLIEKKIPFAVIV